MQMHSQPFMTACTHIMLGYVTNLIQITWALAVISPIPVYSLKFDYFQIRLGKV